MPKQRPETPDPLEQQREVMNLISQGTRHQILQTILGHPDHLPSLDELDHMIPSRSRSTIDEAAETLIEGGIVALYEISNEEIEAAGKSPRDNPNQFYGLSEKGVRVLSEFKFLRAIPVLRATYDHTMQTEKTERHLKAARPELPEAVAEALAFEEVAEEEIEVGEEPASAERSIYADAESGEEDGTLDALFED